MQFTFQETATERKNRVHVEALNVLINWCAQAGNESELSDRIEVVNKRMNSQTQSDKRAPFEAKARDAYATAQGAQGDESSDGDDDTSSGESAPSEATEKPARARKAA